MSHAETTEIAENINSISVVSAISAWDFLVSA